MSLITQFCFFSSYEKSDTHRVEVPRMFLERDELANLQKYTEKTRDK